MDNEKPTNRKNILKDICLEDIKLRYVFFIIGGIYFIDFLSTVIALNLFTGFVEANPIHAQLFALGGYGWFISIFFTGCLLFLLTLIIGMGGKFVKKSEEKLKVRGYYNVYLMFVTGVFSGFEIVVIINNIGLLLSVL